MTGCPPNISVPSEMLQELDFSQCPLRQDLFAEDIGDFFDSNTFPRLGVGRSTISERVSAFCVCSVKLTYYLSP
jgi:hypothetical protein